MKKIVLVISLIVLTGCSNKIDLEDNQKLLECSLEQQYSDYTETQKMNVIFEDDKAIKMIYELEYKSENESTIEKLTKNMKDSIENLDENIEAKVTTKNNQVILEMITTVTENNPLTENDTYDNIKNELVGKDFICK